jgi:hypothetical protein
MPLRFQPFASCANRVDQAHSLRRSEPDNGKTKSAQTEVDNDHGRNVARLLHLACRDGAMARSPSRFGACTHLGPTGQISQTRSYLYAC